MRLFIGYMLPEKTRNQIASLYERLKELDIKLVEPENLHINLKFIGEVEDAKIEGLKNILLELKSSFKASWIGLEGVGVFPSLKRIRIIWVGIKDTNLKQMAEFIDKRAALLGIPSDKRAFEPHLTLGRVKSDRNIKIFTNSFKELQKTAIDPVLVNEIALMKSVLMPEGPKYEKIFSVILNEE